MNDSSFRMAITHTAGVAGFSIKYLYNGTLKTHTNTSGTFVPVTQNLLLGAYQTADGTKGRFWDGTLHNFTVYDSVFSDEDINAYLNG
jgi:hypothetical protein